MSAFERKLSANPQNKANYDALSDRAKRVLLDHFAGLKRDVVIPSSNWSNLFGREVNPPLFGFIPAMPARNFDAV